MLRCITKDCRQSNTFYIKNFLYNSESLTFPITIENGKLKSKQIMVGSKIVIDDLEAVWPLILKQNVKVLCAHCNEEYYIHTLIDGYNHPMAIFDTNNLCDCGGEIFNDVTYTAPTTEAEEWSGDEYQRKVKSNLGIAIQLKCERCGKEFPQHLNKK